MARRDERCHNRRADIAAYAIRTSSIEVTLDPPKGSSDHGRRRSTHHALLNLIINAQQSLQDRSLPRRIRVTSCFDSLAEVVCITVADNGPGIPAHLRARVFEPYFTTKPTGIGLGVGLAVSLGIVEAHGGTLTVNCPTEGGAAFTITLPVGDVDATGAETLRPSSASASRCAILIVDDEAEIRETLAEILTSAQHRVVTVGST